MTRDRDQESADRLEQEFFGRQHAEALQELKMKTGREAQRDALRDVVRIHDDAFLDRLLTMGISPEKALALRLIPLIFVAWADGELDEREREAVLRAAREQSLASDRIGQALLRSWLTSKPDPRLMTQWKDSVRRVWSRFTADEQWQMRKNLLGTAREVSEAAGGFLGLTSKISAQEQAVLADLESVLE